MIELTDRQINVALRAMRGMTGVGDGMEYRCGFRLPLTGSYLQGAQGYFHPHDWVDFHKAVAGAEDPTAALMQLFEEDGDRGTTHFARAFVRDLNGHPIVTAFARGIDRGVGANLAGLPKFIEGHSGYEEVPIDRDHMELALVSGAVFGDNTNFGEILKLMQKRLRYASPNSFEEEVNGKFWNAYQGNADLSCHRTIPTTLNRRRKMFGDAMFKAAKRYGLD